MGSNKLTNRTTDAAGRCDTLTKGPSSKGVYKLVFGTGDYFKALKMDTFFPLVEVSTAVGSRG